MSHIGAGRAEALFDVLTEIVDHPQFDDSQKLALTKTLAISSLEYGAAVRVLCQADLLLGASTTLRSQFEAFIRSTWIMHCANEHQIARLTRELSLESQQASKNIPSSNEMLGDLNKVPQLINLCVSLNEFKESSWGPLNSFVHAGIHAVHWTKNAPPAKLIDTIFRASNGLCVLAYQSLGILTGRPHTQREVIAATSCYSSVLPFPRAST